MGLLDKVKDKLNAQSSSSSTSSDHPFPAPPPVQPLGPDLIPRYRKQRGVNLGSWFVLEKWIAPGPFRNAASPGESDLDIAKGRDAKAILEQHWDSWIKDEDWRWIKERGYNSVRIPIGYYHLCASCPDVMKGTEFEPFVPVFQGAWQRIEKAIDTAGKNGLGVFVDLHCAAGAQNGSAHSGTSNSPSLFSSSNNLKSTSLALRFLSSTLSRIPHVIGLELLNEPDNSMKLQGWYERTLSECRAVAGPDFPLYVSDAWDTSHYAGWVGGRSTGSSSDWVACDHHLYRSQGENDKRIMADQHVHLLRTSFADQFNGWSEAAKGNLVIGEFSASLDGRSLPNGIPDGERDRLMREFARAELDLFERSSAGWWFWTYKKQDGWDAGWSARDATQAEILPGWVGGGKFKGPPGGNAKDQACHQAESDHTNYWKTHGGSPHPQIFASGFSQGFDDQLLFLSSASELGFVQQWAKRRMAEYESTGQKLGGADWEWEHGFKQGAEACKRVCLA